MKQAWQNPQLIVLVRSKPEEAVLVTCKEVDADPGTGPQVSQRGCWTPECMNCQLTTWGS